MGSNPINLALRFLLEMAALLAMGYWGWTRGTGFLRYVLALGIPFLAAALWVTLRVPGDASSSGEAPIPVPGVVRLALELGFFAFGTWALHNAGATTPAWILGAAVVVHYLLSFDRVGWLIRQ